jgi:predicted phage tail component-like protein
MSNYNTGRLYNHKLPDGGAMYNSAPYAVIVYDGGAGQDAIASLFANVSISDAGEGTEAVKATVTLYPITDTGEGQDNISLTANIPVSDTGVGQDNIHSVLCNISVKDDATGEEYIGIAQTFFIIDADNILQPLNVLIVGDSRTDTFPKIKEHAEQIPGKHGDIHFGSKLGGRILELHVVSLDSMSPAEKEEFKRNCAMYLNPVQGAKPLVFWDDLDKKYNVKYAGKISPTQYADWMEFTIPFRTIGPYIEGSFIRTFTGTGAITNNGNIETPLIIEIEGADSNPTIAIGDSIIGYNGDIPANKVLVIDTNKLVATIDGVSVLDDITGDIDVLLPVGQTSITAGGNVTFTWHERWI